MATLASNTQMLMEAICGKFLTLNKSNITLGLGIGESIQWGGPDGIMLQPFFRHALAIVLHLLFAVSLIVVLCWRRCKFRIPWATSHVPVDGSSIKLKMGFMYKLILGCCVLLSVWYTIVGIWNPLNWWLKGSPKDFSTEEEYIVQAIAWFIMSSYAHHSARKEGKEKFPLLLRVWWTLSFVLGVFFLFLDILLFKKQKIVPPYIWVDILALPICAILCYASCFGRTVVDSFKRSIQEPLLNGIPEKTRNLKQVTPYATASLKSLMSFSWMNPLLAVGFKKPLQIDDVPQVADVDTADGVYRTFRGRFEAGGLTHSIAKVIFLSVWKEVLLTSFFAALNSCASYVGPYLIDDFVQYLDGRRQFAYEGSVLVCAFFVAKIIESLAQRHWFFKTQQIGIRIKVALTATIYRKGLSLSNQSRQKHTSGEIINYMSVDAQRIGDFSWYLHDIWIVPLQVILALIILYQNLGLASLAGLATTVAVMMGNFPLGKMQEKFQNKIMEAKDKRMKATSETLRNMRILKLQAWETRFLQKLENLRKVECGWLQKYVYTSAMTTFVFWGAPTFVSVVTFGTCMLMGVPLTAGRILSALATFRILQEPIYNLPDLISMIAQTKVSLARIAAFLQQEDLQHDTVENVSKDSTNIAIEIQGGEFSWDPASPSPTLRGLDLEVKRGMRVAICGTVGSGKSSLLSCMLGEIPKISGTVRISGTKAYVPQSPWIQSGKIEDTILFGKQMDRIRYESVLQACSLKKDLELFPYGDQTDIGERGINLSGGQKQRIQIARAIYQDADIYFFDDPFSAVDAHTGTQIFHECLLGLLGSKTIVYVTHQVEFLPAADLILVMRDGQITQAGRYDDILQLGTDFVELVGAHQKALEAIDAMEKSSDRLLPQIFAEELCDGSTVSVKEINLVECLKQDNPQKLMEVEAELEFVNHKASEMDTDSKKAQLVQEEEREKGRVSMHVYWLYITAAYKGALIPIIIMAQIVFQLLQIGSNYWMAWASPTTEVKRSRVSNSLLILVYVALALGSSLCVLVRAMLLSMTGFKTAKQLFSNMHRCIFRAPMSFFDATPTGRILNRTSTDQSAVDTTIPFQLGALAFSIIQLLGIIAVMSQVAWQVFIMFIPVAATCIWYQQYYIATARELARLVGVCKAPIIQHFAESISGAATIRSFDQESRFMRTNLHLCDGFSRPSFHNAGAMEWLCFRLDLLSTFVFAFSMVFLVCLPEGVMDPSIAGLAITYGLNLNIIQAWVIWNLCNVENKMISVERILQYSRIPSEPPLIIEECRPNADWPFRGKIDLYDLQVRYGPHLPLVLKGLKCTFPGGMKVGVVGRTGSGKSTLIQALFRIVEPAGGRILIDEIDISTIGLHDLRSKLSIIPQDPTMFEGTIRTNLDPLEDYPDAEIWKALEKCQLAEVVKAKEEKLDSLVTENGENWSVGQRQLVCLGRALLKHSRILVLDEATASVDTATDGLIQHTIHDQFSDCTVVTIAHRIPSVVDSDLVLVLNDGEIAEYDSPAKLLEDKSSSFAKLVSEYSIRSNNVSGKTHKP
eukprot:Gb_38867 [translate_table: standard]